MWERLVQHSRTAGQWSLQRFISVPHVKMPHMPWLCRTHDAKHTCTVLNHAAVHLTICMRSGVYWKAVFFNLIRSVCSLWDNLREVRQATSGGIQSILTHRWNERLFVIQRNIWGAPQMFLRIVCVQWNHEKQTYVPLWRIRWLQGLLNNARFTRRILILQMSHRIQGSNVLLDKPVIGAVSCSFILMRRRVYIEKTQTTFCSCKMLMWQKNDSSKMKSSLRSLKW